LTGCCCRMLRRKTGEEDNGESNGERKAHWPNHTPTGAASRSKTPRAGTGDLYQKKGADRKCQNIKSCGRRKEEGKKEKEKGKKEETTGTNRACQK